MKKGIIKITIPVLQIIPPIVFRVSHIVSTTERPKIYSKSILHLLKYRCAVYYYNIILKKITDKLNQNEAAL